MHVPASAMYMCTCKRYGCRKCSVVQECKELRSCGDSAGTAYTWLVTDKGYHSHVSSSPALSVSQCSATALSLCAAFALFGETVASVHENTPTPTGHLSGFSCASPTPPPSGTLPARGRLARRRRRPLRRQRSAAARLPASSCRMDADTLQQVFKGETDNVVTSAWTRTLLHAQGRDEPRINIHTHCTAHTHTLHCNLQARRVRRVVSGQGAPDMHAGYSACYERGLLRGLCSAVLLACRAFYINGCCRPTSAMLAESSVGWCYC